jgi:hypothetical protein
MGTKEKDRGRQVTGFKTKIRHLLWIKETADRIRGTMELTGHIRRGNDGSGDSRRVPAFDRHKRGCGSVVGKWKMEIANAHGVMARIICNNQRGSVGNRGKIVKRIATICGAGHSATVDVSL